MSKSKIISIMPATGWVACFKYQVVPEAPVEEWQEPLVAWALVEYEDGYRFIAGYTFEEPGSGVLGDVAEHPSFHGYELASDV